MARKRKQRCFQTSFLLLPSCKHHVDYEEHTHTHTHKHTHTQSTHPHATRVYVCARTHTHTHPEQSSWKLLPSGRCPEDCRISGMSQNRWLWPSDCCWTYLCRKVSLVVRRLGTVTLGKLDCVWRPRGLFCTLQLVWQAPPPPGSAMGMGNTQQSGGQEALPRYSITHLCFAHKTYSNGHIFSRWMSRTLCPDEKALNLCMRHLFQHFNSEIAYYLSGSCTDL